jgi:predicted nucleotidyltransferase
LTTLGRLLAGAGFAPSVDLVSTARPSALVSAHKEQLRALANRYRVRSIHVFGSAATGEDGPDSDLDLLVEFEPSVSGLDRIDFAEEVEKLLGIRVDMVNPAAAEPRFLRIIRPQLRPLDDF